MDTTDGLLFLPELPTLFPGRGPLSRVVFRAKFPPTGHSRSPRGVSTVGRGAVTGVTGRVVVDIWSYGQTVGRVKEVSKIASKSWM